MIFCNKIMDIEGREVPRMMLYYTNTIGEIEILKYFEVHSSSVARPTTKTYKAAYTTMTSRLALLRKPKG